MSLPCPFELLHEIIDWYFVAYVVFKCSRMPKCDALRFFAHPRAYISSFVYLRNKNEKWCIIHLPSNSRRGDTFDRSMTRGKLLGNNAQLSIFISYSNNDQTNILFTHYAYCS